MDVVNSNIHFFMNFIFIVIDANTVFVYNPNMTGGACMSMVEAIRVACVKRGNISEAELARRVGVTPQNFNNKMKRDNFSERDLQEIADALGLRLEISFIDPATGEKV